jgi:hypothetical protein
VLSRHHLPLQEEAEVSRPQPFRASCADDDAEPESWPESESTCDSEQVAIIEVQLKKSMFRTALTWPSELARKS